MSQNWVSFVCDISKLQKLYFWDFVNTEDTEISQMRKFFCEMTHNCVSFFLWNYYLHKFFLCEMSKIKMRKFFCEASVFWAKLQLWKFSEWNCDWGSFLRGLSIAIFLVVLLHTGSPSANWARTKSTSFKARNPQVESRAKSHWTSTVSLTTVIHIE